MSLSPSILDRTSWGKIPALISSGTESDKDSILDWAYSSVPAEIYYTWCDLAGQSFRYDDDWTGKHPSMSHCTKAQHIRNRGF
jgi:hypothetical protein